MKQPAKARKPAKRKPRKAARRGRGHPPFEPTPEQRKTVEAMAGYGIIHEDIRLVVTNPESGAPIDAKTLRKHFSAELARGHVIANAKVAESLFNQAVGKARVMVDGKVVATAVAPVVAAAIFWCKARMGWRERVEVTGKDGAPVIEAVDLSKLTEKQLAALDAILRTAAVADADRGGEDAQEPQTVH